MHAPCSFEDEKPMMLTLSKRAASSDQHLFELGYAPAPPPPPPEPLCKGCNTTNPHDFTATADKSHLVCKCGIVSYAIHVATDREKNCTKDEDKTTHADKPYEPKTDRFDHPAKSCEELRKEREREAAPTRISKKAKQKHNIGWTHEHGAREAANADRQRQEMSPKDQTKGNHIQIELDKLFTPLEPLDNKIKRFCRMEADRAWRTAVRHCAVCQANGRCQLRVREKGPAVIADAVLSCSVQTLLDGKVEALEGVKHAGLLVIANKLGAQQAHKGTSCALRAVRTIIGTLLAHRHHEPIASCSVVVTHLSCQPSPVYSSSSDASSARLLGMPNGAPFARINSSVSDFGEPPGETLQLRDCILTVFRALGTSMPNRVREATLRAIQDADFRAALDVARQENDDVSKLPLQGLAYVLLEATAQQLNKTAVRANRGVPSSLLSSFGVSVARLNAAVETLSALLPARTQMAAATQEQDGLFV